MTVNIIAKLRFVRTLITLSVIPILLLKSSAFAASETIQLNGASMFGDDHVFTRTMVEFSKRVEDYYDGDIKFKFHLKSSAGVERDYVQYLTDGDIIDFAIIAPSNMGYLAPSIPLMDMPFLFRDEAHWQSVLSSDAFKPLEQELLDKSDIMIIGYTGGGVRNIIASEPVRSLDDLKNFKMRVMGAPIQKMIFDALGAAAEPIVYSEVYERIQTGLLDGFENEAAAIKSLSFYEVAPFITLTQHTITVRPILFSAKVFEKLPEALQKAILKAGKEAGEFGREIESREDAEKLKEMAEEGKIQLIEFSQNDDLLNRLIPVQDEYAKSINAMDVLTDIRNKAEE